MTFPDPGFKCAKCGSCAQVCPVYLETGRESHCARGKLHLFGKEIHHDSKYYHAILAQCLQCGACDDICPRDLEPSRIIRRLRSEQPPSQTEKGYTTFFTRTILNSPALIQAAGKSLNLLQKLPKASGLRNKLHALVPRETVSIPAPIADASTPLLYYPGCLAHHIQTEIDKATRYLASLCGYKLSVPKEATCCGIASSSSGKEQEARKQALRNIQAFAGNAEPILTSCASCYAQLKSYPKLFAPATEEHRKAQEFAGRVQEFATFFLGENKLFSDAQPEQVYYHDPCHLRFGAEKICTAPRQLIWNLNGAAVVNNEQPLGCCGQGGLFALVNRDLSEAIFTKIQRKVEDSSQTIVVTTCSSCLMGWQQGTQDTAVESLHLSVFLAKRCTS